MKKAQLLNPELFDSEKYHENKISESADILKEAEEIKKDSVLMGHIQKYWDSEGKKIKSLKDLKHVANNFSNDNEEGESAKEEKEEE